MAETPTSCWTGINDAADCFERDWKGGLLPLIENYLAEVHESRRPALLEELLRVELELRRSAGEDPAPGEYATRFPEHLAVIEAVIRPGLESPDAPRATHD